MSRPISSYKYSLLLLFSLLTFVNAPASFADGNVAYWISMRNNMVVDNQVSQILGKHAGVIVLRANKKGPRPKYNFAALVNRLKRFSPNAKVLAYAWVTRQAEKGHIEADILSGMDNVRTVAYFNNVEHGHIEFIDVSNPIVQKKILSRLMEMREKLGVDGFAFDLSFRTPNQINKPLYEVCQRNEGYCIRYGRGMDKLYSDIHHELGNEGYFIYNGLWDFSPGLLEDQAKLLKNADGVAIEYFGMNPDKNRKAGSVRHSFKKNILPYLRVSAHLPLEKSVMFFARGPYKYINYEDEYNWQRYLYASYLLAANKNDLFIYHASFQVPANGGRTNAMSYYLDWSLELGQARGGYSIKNNIYARYFTDGLVLVSPDDGFGGNFYVDGTHYTPECKTITGDIKLLPGTGLILLNSSSQCLVKPSTKMFNAKSIATWGWFRSELLDNNNGGTVRLGALQDKKPRLIGEHDLLLDYERSSSPYQELAIKAKLLSSSSLIEAVAEVNDPDLAEEFVVVNINKNTSDVSGTQYTQAIDFRTPPKLKNQDIWPLLNVKYNNDGLILINGPELFNGTSYHFMRWAYLRFVGPVELSTVTLSKPVSFFN